MKKKTQKISMLLTGILLSSVMICSAQDSIAKGKPDQTRKGSSASVVKENQMKQKSLQQLQHEKAQAASKGQPTAEYDKAINQLNQTLTK